MNLALISLFSVAVATCQFASAFAPGTTNSRVFSPSNKAALFSTTERTQHEVVSSRAVNTFNNERVTPIDHEFELTVNRIRSLVFRWMSIFDENRGDAAPLIDLMSPEGFALHLTSTPEPITTITALQSWFGELVTKVKTVNHRVQSIDVTKLEDGAFAVEILLTCPGMSTSNVPFNLSSVHNWEVVDYGGQYPKIRRFATKVVNPDGSAMSFDQANR